MMIQQSHPAFRLEEIQFASAYTVHQREAILAVLQQASDECKLISRACTVAAKRQLPLPKTPEAFMSFMLYETQLHESLIRSFYEIMTSNEKTLDLQATSCLAQIWEYIALLRKFVNLLYAVKVEPEQIAWENVMQEGAVQHTYSFGFVLKGFIGTNHERYAEAYQQATRAMESIIGRVEGEARATPGVSYVLVIDRNITPE